MLPLLLLLAGNHPGQLPSPIFVVVVALVSVVVVAVIVVIVVNVVIAVLVVVGVADVVVAAQATNLVNYKHLC